jgi:hypothetical protein
MKTFKTLTVLLFLLAANVGYAQKNQERIMSLKVAHISNAIALTPEEAVDFWPIYNKYATEMKTIEKEMRRDLKGAKPEKSIEDMSDAEANNILLKRMTQKQTIMKLKNDQITALKKVVSAKKLLKLQKAEREFRKNLLQEYRKRKVNK